MFDDMIEVVILLALGLFIGVIISLFYWSRQVGRREDEIEELENLNNEKDSEKPFFDIPNFLNGLRWRNLSLEELQAIQIGFREMDSIKYISADMIISSDRHYFYVEEHRIPIHRIRIIKEGNQVLYRSTKLKDSQDPES